MPCSPMHPPPHDIARNGEPPASRPDSWAELTQFTGARIALGRAGASWRTQTLLNFRLAHAQARDAVGRPFDADNVEQQLRRLSYETARLTTQAQTRALFLQRPDLGRKLSNESRAELLNRAGPAAFQDIGRSFPLSQRERAGVREDHPNENPAPIPGELSDSRWSGRHLAILVSDGLSSLAAETQAAPLLAELLPLLARAGWTLCPIFIVPFARVKLQDEIGGLLGVRHALALLGERPGLGSPDSLGAYFTFEPGPDKTDADRNCISNIRPQGLPPKEAAKRLAQLLLLSEEQRCSGIHLKESAKSINAIG